MPTTDAPTDWFVDRLSSHGEVLALLTQEGTLTYAELDRRVESVADQLGGRRRLVLLAGANHSDAIVHYLAALRGRHPVVVVDADNGAALERITDVYDPDVVVRPRTDDSTTWELREVRSRTRHELHPDLALLLSTSGSTGSPKLVRLSRTNVESNAGSISSCLSIGAADRAVTSLPMAYSFGLSVINSHLHSGASVVVTNRSVIDPEFWEVLRRTHATSFAGVPYTFELLDRVGFPDMALPDLRSVLQAGGRLDPETVRRYAELGRRSGWDLFVMYGQTEATARIAVLPPLIASTRPETIGVPIPGGAIRIEPLPDGPADGGELVYTGPNVMLGYADGPADLARGRTVQELRTGDLGRRGADGMYEIVGRRSEFLKISGHRIDLRGVERLLEGYGARACAVGTDEQLVVFTGSDAPSDIETRVRDSIALPSHALRVHRLPELPRLPNGKLDRARMRTMASGPGEAVTQPPRGDVTVSVRELYASAFGIDDVSDADSFSSLGGDSLSYVEVSLGLEDALGRLPDGWATMPIRQLGARGAAAPRRRGWSGSLAGWRSIETSVVLRALAIVLVVATHIGMVAAPGGAHVLMAVAGFNFARFRLTTAHRADRVRSQLRAVARIAIPAIAWVALAMVLLGQYELRHLLLINALVQDELWGNLWFIEVLVYISLLMAALLAIPAVDRAERRWPFGSALAVLSVGLLFRYEVIDVGVPHTMPVLWLFALGWAASRADRRWQRSIVLGLAIASIPGYFDAWERNALILAGVVLLVVFPRVVVPRALAPLAGTLAAASLYIYLVHWEVWPMFSDWYGIPSLLASLLAGVALWFAASRTPRIAAALMPPVRAWTSAGDAHVRRPAS